MKTVCVALWAFVAGVVALAVAAANAEVVATARSPEGKFPEFRVVLDAAGAPVAVANFMGLVDGTQTWVDPETGRGRGGSGDAFYEGMVFDWNMGSVLRGGLRKVTGTNGVAEYSGGPGYTILSEVGASGWSEVDEGSLAMVERIPTWDGMQRWLGWELDVLNSGGGELALFLTNAVVQWTVFGHVAAGDEAGLRALAASVGAGATEVRWEVDMGRATEAERQALEAARAELPAVAGVEARVNARASVEWALSGKSRLELSQTVDPAEDWRAVDGIWNEATNRTEYAREWQYLGMEGERGFVALAEVRCPGMAGKVPEGKWWFGVEHTEQRMEYWLDFSGGEEGGTGTWERVIDGQVTSRGSLSHVKAVRETANSLRVWFSLGQNVFFYWFGVPDEGATGGRFQWAQVTTSGSTKDYGTYECREGWARKEESLARKKKKAWGKLPKLGAERMPGELPGDFPGRGPAVPPGRRTMGPDSRIGAAQ